MSAPILPPPRRVLHLVIEGAPMEEIDAVAAPIDHTITEIFPLSEATARDALAKIFAADSVAVWGRL